MESNFLKQLGSKRFPLHQELSLQEESHTLEDWNDLYEEEDSSMQSDGYEASDDEAEPNTELRSSALDQIITNEGSMASTQEEGNDQICVSSDKKIPMGASSVASTPVAQLDPGASSDEPSSSTIQSKPEPSPLILPRAIKPSHISLDRIPTCPLVKLLRCINLSCPATGSGLPLDVDPLSPKSQGPVYGTIRRNSARFLVDSFLASVGQPSIAQSGVAASASGLPGPLVTVDTRKLTVHRVPFNDLAGSLNDKISKMLARNVNSPPFTLQPAQFPALSSNAAPDASSSQPPAFRLPASVIKEALQTSGGGSGEASSRGGSNLRPSLPQQPLFVLSSAPGGKAWVRLDVARLLEALPSAGHTLDQQLQLHRHHAPLSRPSIQAPLSVFSQLSPQATQSRPQGGSSSSALPSVPPSKMLPKQDPLINAPLPFETLLAAVDSMFPLPSSSATRKALSNLSLGKEGSLGEEEVDSLKIKALANLAAKAILDMYRKQQGAKPQGKQMRETKTRDDKGEEGEEEGEGKGDFGDGFSASPVDPRPFPVTPQRFFVSKNKLRDLWIETTGGSSSPLGSFIHEQLSIDNHSHLSGLLSNIRGSAQLLSEAFPLVFFTSVQEDGSWIKAEVKSYIRIDTDAIWQAARALGPSPALLLTPDQMKPATTMGRQGSGLDYPASPSSSSYDFNRQSPSSPQSSPGVGGGLRFAGVSPDSSLVDHIKRLKEVPQYVLILAAEQAAPAAMSFEAQSGSISDAMMTQMTLKSVIMGFIRTVKPELINALDLSTYAPCVDLISVHLAKALSARFNCSLGPIAICQWITRKLQSIHDKDAGKAGQSSSILLSHSVNGMLRVSINVPLLWSFLPGAPSPPKAAPLLVREMERAKPLAPIIIPPSYAQAAATEASLPTLTQQLLSTSSNKGLSVAKPGSSQSLLVPVSLLFKAINRIHPLPQSPASGQSSNISQEARALAREADRQALLCNMGAKALIRTFWDQEQLQAVSAASGGSSEATTSTISQLQGLSGYDSDGVKVVLWKKLIKSRILVSQIALSVANDLQPSTLPLPPDSQAKSGYEKFSSLLHGLPSPTKGLTAILRDASSGLFKLKTQPDQCTWEVSLDGKVLWGSMSIVAARSAVRINLRTVDPEVEVEMEHPQPQERSRESDEVMPPSEGKIPDSSDAILTETGRISPLMSSLAALYQAGAKMVKRGLIPSPQTLIVLNPPAAAEILQRNSKIGKGETSFRRLSRWGGAAAGLSSNDLLLSLMKEKGGQALTLPTELNSWEALSDVQETLLAAIDVLWPYSQGPRSIAELAPQGLRSCNQAARKCVEVGSMSLMQILIDGQKAGARAVRVDPKAFQAPLTAPAANILIEWQQKQQAQFFGTLPSMNELLLRIHMPSILGALSQDLNFVVELRSDQMLSVACHVCINSQSNESKVLGALGLE